MALLEVSNLGIAFGGLQAVSQLDLKIEKGHLQSIQIIVINQTDIRNLRRGLT